MEDSEGNKRKNSDPLPNAWNIFQSIRLRCPFEMVNGYDRQLLDFNFRFLPCIGIILYILFCVI